MKKFHKSSKYNYNKFKNYLTKNQILFLYSVKRMKREMLYKTRQQLNAKNIKLVKINNIISKKIFINQLNKKYIHLFQSENLIGFPSNIDAISIKSIIEICNLKLISINLIGIIINKKLIIPHVINKNNNINQLMYNNLFNTLNYLSKRIIFSTTIKPKFFLLPLYFNIKKQ